MLQKVSKLEGFRILELRGLEGEAKNLSLVGSGHRHLCWMNHDSDILSLAIPKFVSYLSMPEPDG